MAKYQYCKLCKCRVDKLKDHLTEQHTIIKSYKQYLEISYEISQMEISKEIKFTIYDYISIQGKNLKKAIYWAFDGKCFYTNEKIDFETMHIDHLIPKNKGGKDCIANYVLTSSFVNKSKRDKELENIDELVQRNIEIYAPKVLRILLNDKIFISRKRGNKTGKPRYNPEKCIYKYTRILAEPQNSIQEKFLNDLISIKGSNGKPNSIAKLEWLTELYQAWTNLKKST